MKVDAIFVQGKPDSDDPLGHRTRVGIKYRGSDPITEKPIMFGFIHDFAPDRSRESVAAEIADGIREQIFNAIMSPDANGGQYVKADAT